MTQTSTTSTKVTAESYQKTTATYTKAPSIQIALSVRRAEDLGLKYKVNFKSIYFACTAVLAGDSSRCLVL
jgi:hypothetical protein